MVSRIVLVLVLIPIAVILITLAVANRGFTPFTLDPFNPGNPALTVEWPLFVFLFLAFALGTVVGSIATWFRQGRYRRLARQRGDEVERLRQTTARETPKTAGTGTPSLPAA